MTNKEAIKVLRNNVFRYISSRYWYSENDALDLAIKALEFQDKVKEACCSSCGVELESYIREILKEADDGLFSS